MFANMTEYFHVSASTIPSNAGIFLNLANDESMKACEDADEALHHYRKSGTDSEIAAAMIARAEVALAFGEQEQARQMAENARLLAKKVGDDKVQAAAVNTIAKVMIEESPTKAVVKAREALNIAKAMGDLYLKACIHYTLAMALVAAKHGEEALIVGRDMVSLFEGSDATGEACALLCASELERATGNQKAAILTARDAASILEIVGDVAKQALALKHAASVALSSKHNAAEGFDLAHKALDLFATAGESRQSNSLKLAMANAKLRAEEYVEAEDWAEEAQAAFNKLGDMKNEAESLQVLATVRLAIAVEDAKDKDEADTMAAMEACREALVLFRKLGSRHGEAQAMRKLAQVRYHTGACDMAHVAAEEAQNMFRELGDTQGEAGAVLLIAHVMHQDSHLDSAKRSATKAFTLYQSIDDKEGMDACTVFLDQTKKAQTEKTKTERDAKKTVSDSGLVKLVNSVDESSHLLSFFADMNEDENTELAEYNLKDWVSGMSTLTLQA